MADPEYKPKRLVGPPPPKAALPDGAAAAADVVKKKMAPPKGAPPVMGDFKMPKHLSPAKKPGGQSGARGDKYAASDDDDDERPSYGRKSHSSDDQPSRAYESRSKSSILRRSKYENDEGDEDSYRPSRNMKKYGDASDSSDNINTKGSEASHAYTASEEDGDEWGRRDNGGTDCDDTNDRDNNDDNYTDENYQEDYNRDGTRDKSNGSSSSTAMAEGDEPAGAVPPSVFRGLASALVESGPKAAKEQAATAKLQAFNFLPILRATYKVLKNFAVSPCPPGQVIKCYIERNRTGKNYFSPFYSLCADLEVRTIQS